MFYLYIHQSPNVVSKVILHSEDHCGYCKNRKPKPLPGGHNDWDGPFANISEARKTAKIRYGAEAEYHGEGACRRYCEAADEYTSN